MGSETTRLNRRGFIKGSAGLVGGALAAAYVSACGGGDNGDETTTNGAGATTPANPTSSTAGAATSSSSSSAGSGGGVLPTYVPYTGVKADLASTSDLVSPGFLQTPSDLVQFSSGAPLHGDKLDVLTNTNVAIPPPLSNNKFWQEFNKQAGAPVSFSMVPNADYVAKLQTSIAGGDLPEIVAMRGVADLPGLLKSKFTDLSEWLSGDNIKKYPGLANIPTLSWRSSVYNGGLYVIPLPRSPIAETMVVRADIVAKRGGNPDIKSFDDFHQLCQTVNDPAHNSWALGAPVPIFDFVREMLGNANGWDNTDGKFTYYAEQDTCKEALSAVAGLWKEGLFQPDSFTSASKVGGWFGAGTIVLNNGGSTGSSYYTAYRATGETPTLEVSLVVPPKYDGGGDGHKYYGAAIYGGGIAYRQNKKARIDELMEFANWLASPFGTTEHQFFSYGVEGVDYTVKDGAPVKTTTGTSELALPVVYTGAAAFVNITPGFADFTKRYYDYQQACAKVAMTQPTLGLYSPTDHTTGATIGKNLGDLTIDIIAGRKSVSDWDGAVKQWRSGGGDTIRKEYQEAYADAS